MSASATRDLELKVCTNMPDCLYKINQEKTHMWNTLYSKYILDAHN